MTYLTFFYLNRKNGIIKEAFAKRGMFDFGDYTQNRIFLFHQHNDKKIVEETSIIYDKLLDQPKSCF